MSADETPSTEEVPTPELDKMTKAREKGHSEAIGEFLEWLSTQGIMLMTYEEIYEDREQTDTRGNTKIDFETGEILMHLNWCVFQGHTPIGKPTEKLLAEYFEVDLDKCEQEKQAILDAHRKRMGYA